MGSSPAATSSSEAARSVPFIILLILMMPLLCLYAIFVGIFGGYIMAQVDIAGGIDDWIVIEIIDPMSINPPGPAAGAEGA